VASLAAPEGRRITHIAVAPAGERIAITMGAPGEEHLAVLTVSGLLMKTPAPKIIVAGGARRGAAFPAWAPDGDTLAFVRTTTTDTGVTGDLCTIKFDGTDAKQLTRVAPTQCVADPCFSPDGATLAIALLTGPASDLYRLDRDGTHLQRLTTDGMSREPAWGR
jgi:Tol biopolymer transport system component